MIDVKISLLLIPNDSVLGSILISKDRYLNSVIWVEWEYSHERGHREQ